MTGADMYREYIERFEALHPEGRKFQVQQHYDRMIAEEGRKPYYKHPVRETSDSSIFLFLWLPEGKTRLHSHCGSEAWIHVLYGTLRHEHFAIWEEDYELIDGSDYPSGVDADVKEPDDVVHRVVNPSLRWLALSLHIFEPPLDSMEVYDFEANKQWPVTGGKDTLGDPPENATRIWPRRIGSSPFA